MIRILMLMAMLIGGCRAPAMASESIAGYSLDQWVRAIYISEGGARTKHPYGIMAKYRSTSPKQACANTILHYWRDYSKLPYKTRQELTFLAYAQSRYCPIGAKNDVDGLNVNWIANVRYFLERGA